MYEKKKLALWYEFNVNTCPHCNQKFVILVEWDNNVVEQVGPTMYCYVCGKIFDENKDNNNPH